MPNGAAADNDFFESAPCGCVLLSLDGSILRSNAKFISMLNPVQGDAVPTKFQETLSRAGSIYYETQFAPALRLRGELQEVALDLRRTDGKRLPVLVNANLRVGPDGSADGFRLTIFVASERRNYETELLDSRNRAERMAEVVQHSSDAVIALDPLGNIQSWNHGAEQVFGFGQSEVLGHSLAGVILPRTSHNAIAEALVELRQGRDVSADTEGVRKDGRAIQLSMTLTPHMEAPGTLVAFSAIVRDVSQRKLTEKALLQSEKLASVGRLASSIAHEINNPLESITNLLYILDTLATDPEMKKYINTAQDEVARVSQIATHTLRFHRQSTKKSHLNIHELFESTLVLYRARLLNSGITATVDGCPDVKLFCFEGELRQILANIVGNAFDAMRNGGRLRLRCRAVTVWSSGMRGIRITVADTGTGMTADTLQHLFEPFFSTKGIAGTGLGLWISKELAEKNGGTIHLRSTTRTGGSGTTFSFLFANATEALS